MTIGYENVISESTLGSCLIAAPKQAVSVGSALWIDNLQRKIKTPHRATWIIHWATQTEMSEPEPSMRGL